MADSPSNHDNVASSPGPEDAPDYRPKILDLPTEILSMIGKAVLDQPENQRGGYADLAHLTTTCREIREVMLETLLEIIVKPRDRGVSTSIPGERIKWICSIPIPQSQSQAEYIPPYLDPIPHGVNSMAMTVLPDGDGGDKLQIKVRLDTKKPDHFDAVSTAIQRGIKSVEHLFQRTAQILVIDAGWGTPGTLQQDKILKVRSQCQPFLSERCKVRCTVGGSIMGTREETTKTVLVAAYFGQPLYITTTGNYADSLWLLSILLEECRNLPSILQLYINQRGKSVRADRRERYSNANLRKIWDSMHTANVTRIQLRIWDGMQRVTGLVWNGQIEPTQEVTEKRWKDIDWKPKNLWDGL